MKKITVLMAAVLAVATVLGSRINSTFQARYKKRKQTHVLQIQMGTLRQAVLADREDSLSTSEQNCDFTGPIEFDED